LVENRLDCPFVFAKRGVIRRLELFVFGFPSCSNADNSAAKRKSTNPSPASFQVALETVLSGAPERSLRPAPLAFQHIGRSHQLPKSKNSN